VWGGGGHRHGGTEGRRDRKREGGGGRWAKRENQSERAREEIGKQGVRDLHHGGHHHVLVERRPDLRHLPHPHLLPIRRPTRMLAYLKSPNPQTRTGHDGPRVESPPEGSPRTHLAVEGIDLLHGGDAGPVLLGDVSVVGVLGGDAEEEGAHGDEVGAGLGEEGGHSEVHAGGEDDVRGDVVVADGVGVGRAGGEGVVAFPAGGACRANGVGRGRARFAEVLISPTGAAVGALGGAGVICKHVGVASGAG
jgi:hypothetical protein